MGPPELSSHAALLAASADDPFVRWMVDPASPVHGWALRPGVAFWRRTSSGDRTLTVVASPQRAAALLPELVAAAAPRMVTVPAGTLPLLARPVDGPGDDWEWMLAEQAPPVQPHERRVHPLPRSPDAVAQVARLLAAASPRHSAAADDRTVQRWHGVHDGGRLVACAAHTEPVPGVPHLASIAVHPQARGTGLGAAVTAAASRAALSAGAPVVTLGMYSDNAVARRLYHRLGFRSTHRWSSRRLPPGWPAG